MLVLRLLVGLHESVAEVWCAPAVLVFEEWRRVLGAGLVVAIEGRASIIRVEKCFLTR